MKLKGFFIAFFALIFWTNLDATRGREPVRHSPIDNLAKWYGPLLMTTPDLAYAGDDYSEEKITALFSELTTSIRLELNNDVFSYIKHYTTGQKTNFEVALSLESLYGAQILNRVIEKNMPREIEFLPLVLS